MIWRRECSSCPQEIYNLGGKIKYAGVCYITNINNDNNNSGWYLSNPYYTPDSILTLCFHSPHSHLWYKFNIIPLYRQGQWSIEQQGKCYGATKLEYKTANKTDRVWQVPRKDYT